MYTFESFFLPLYGAYKYLFKSTFQKGKNQKFKKGVDTSHKPEGSGAGQK